MLRFVTRRQQAIRDVAGPLAEDFSTHVSEHDRDTSFTFENCDPA